MSTKFAYGIAVWDWLKGPDSRYHCTYYSNALSSIKSFKLNFGLLKWK